MKERDYEIAWKVLKDYLFFSMGLNNTNKEEVEKIIGKMGHIEEEVERVIERIVKEVGNEKI